MQNNPLKYTDPSGYFLKKLFKAIKKAFKSIVRAIKKYARVIVAAVVSYFTYGLASAWAGSAFIGGAAAGFVGGGIMTGTLKGALRGALYGGLSAGIAYGIGHGFGANWGDVGQAFAHGVAQGGLSEAFGGDFRSGFIGGVIGHWSGEKLISRIKGRDFGAIATRTSIAAVAGGLSAKLGGGKFSNGAVSAAFVHVFNSEGGAGEGYYDKQKTWESEMRLVEATGGGDIATLLDAASLLAPGASVSINLDGNAHYYERYHLMQTERIYIDKATGDILDSQYIGEKKWYHDMGYGPQDGFKHIGKGVYEWNVRTFSPIAPKVIKLPYQADRYRNFF